MSLIAEDSFWLRCLPPLLRILALPDLNDYAEDAYDHRDQSRALRAPVLLCRDYFNAGATFLNAARQRSEAIALRRRGFAIWRQTGPSFLGLWLLCHLAFTVDRPERLHRGRTSRIVASGSGRAASSSFAPRRSLSPHQGISVQRPQQGTSATNLPGADIPANNEGAYKSQSRGNCRWICHVTVADLQPIEPDLKQRTQCAVANRLLMNSLKEMNVGI